MRWLLVAVLLTGCATAKPTLSRFDGKPVSRPQLEQAHTECDAKASAATGMMPDKPKQAAWADAVQKWDLKQSSYEGCMAEKGYRVVYN